MSTDVSSKPPRWRWAVLGLLVVGALSVPTGIVYLQHCLQAQPHDTARPWDDPVIARKLTDARLEKAKAIRLEWRAWALKHKDALRMMLASKGKDFSTLQAVYKVSPPLKDGDWRPDTRSGTVKFGWYVDMEKEMANGETINWADAESKSGFESHRGGAQRKLKKEFADESDFTIAVSENAGPSMHIWASGRITERSFVETSVRQDGQTVVMKEVHKELMPPFDFLTSANSG